MQKLVNPGREVCLFIFCCILLSLQLSNLHDSTSDANAVGNLPVFATSLHAALMDTVIREIGKQARRADTLLSRVRDND